MLKQEEQMGRPTFEANGNLRAESSPLEGLEQLLTPQSDNSRMVFLHSDVTENVVANVVAQLLHLANVNRAPIHLVISTYGGSLDEMFSLYDTIKFLPCPVHTVALGKVMSAGVLLLASGVKGKRLIGSSARIMMHPISGGAHGNVFELENSIKEAKRQQELMVSTLVKETKMTRAQIGKVMDPMLDYYMTPQDAIDNGIVDKIIGAI
jgi:ATP-dependent Clp protease protease subunit